MEFIGDYHLHTRVSDGRATVARHVSSAKQRGLEQIAISDHSFDTFLFHATKKKLQRQKQEIASLSDSGIKIYHGIEANIVGDELDVPHSVIRGLDVLTAGFHRYIAPSKMRGNHKFLLVNGFGSHSAKEKLVCKNTEAYLSVMQNYPIDIIAHLGHRAPVDFFKVCECAKSHNVYIELNAKHLDALENDIECALESGVDCIVGTDAHSAKNTGDFKAVEAFIKKHNIPLERVYGINGNTPSFKDKREWVYGRDV